MNTPDLQLLGHSLAAHGAAAHAGELRVVARAATAAGVSPVLVAVLADPAAPEVARLRAFGHIATHLDRRAPAPAPRPQPARLRRSRRRRDRVAPAA